MVLVVQLKIIVKDVVSLFKAVNEKTKSHLAAMTQEYEESTLWDLSIHMLWQDINTLPGTMHIHCVEQTDKGNVSTTCSTVINPLLSISWTQLS